MQMTKVMSQLSSFLNCNSNLPVMGSYSTPIILYRPFYIYDFSFIKLNLLIFVKLFDKKNYFIFSKSVIAVLRGCVRKKVQSKIAVTVLWLSTWVIYLWYYLMSDRLDLRISGLVWADRSCRRGESVCMLISSSWSYNRDRRSNRKKLSWSAF